MNLHIGLGKKSNVQITANSNISILFHNYAISISHSTWNSIMETEPLVLVFEFSLLFFFLMVFAFAIKTTLDGIWNQYIKRKNKE